MAAVGESSTTGSPLMKIFPRVRPLDAGEALDQRGLAGTVVADHGQDLTREQLEVRAIEGRDIAVALDQTLRL
jgi:hypothetical protein